MSEPVDLMAVGDIEWWPLDKVLPYARNAKTHDDGGVAQLAGMIKEFGWTYPILVDEEGVILAGHKRRLASQRLGLVNVPVLVKKGLDKHQKQAYRIADNKTTENSPWDVGLLKIEIGELRDAGMDLGLTAWDGEELKAFFGEEKEPPPDPGPQVDRAEELREKWQVETGQLWKLGEHRLICGDCTDAAVVARLMGGEKAEMVWTDPPYGVGVGDKNKFLNSIARSNRIEENLQNDTLDEPGLIAMLCASFDNAAAHCTAGAAWYVAAPPGPLHVLFGQVLKDRGIWRQTIQWVKNNATFSPMGVCYHWQAEPIFFGWLPNGAHRFYGGRTQTTVWNIDRPSKSPEHPTMKPVELVARAVENSSIPGEIVYDPFSGSGTTIAACEQLGRRCRAVEIALGYVAVALQRWADMTGKEPELMDG